MSAGPSTTTHPSAACIWHNARACSPAKQITPEAIKADLEATKRIAPPMKSRMLRNLPETFPEKYRRLVGAYYRTLLEEKARPTEKEE